ncbi:MAG: murein transglycosylase A [Halioglobus sp.]
MKESCHRKTTCSNVTVRSLFFSMVAVLSLTSCSWFLDDSEVGLVLTPVAYSALPGWQDDDLNAAMVAFQKSCTPIQMRNQDELFGSLPEAGTNALWQQACVALENVDKENSRVVRKYLEDYFQAFEVRDGSSPIGLFTGYYEASLKGSRIKTDHYRYPLHARPDDLVMVNLGEFRDNLRGVRIAGRVSGGTLKPYEERAQIVEGNWPHNDKVLIWVDDAVDAFFAQIQGSAVVELEDGSVTRIGYAGQNGHVYYAIGRELVKRGYLAKEHVSLQSIRSWLNSNPDQADEIMNTNRSYVFFSERNGGDGPMGGQGVPLTPERSLAIDHSLIPYGAPVWVDIYGASPEGGDLRRLMIAQDTGGAIRGAVRGDFFWGFGDHAESLAGPMNAQGRYWLLLPKNFVQ